LTASTIQSKKFLRRALNLHREHAEEESLGLVRWLRPEFQHPEGSRPPTATQATLRIAIEEPAPVPTGTAAKAPPKRPWPKTLAEQAQAVRSALAEHPAGLTPDQLARLFLRARADRVSDLLDALASLGQARAVEDGRYLRT
jgi:hypothetical protein